MDRERLTAIKDKLDAPNIPAPWAVCGIYVPELLTYIDALEAVLRECADQLDFYASLEDPLGEKGEYEKAIEPVRRARALMGVGE